MISVIQPFNSSEDLTWQQPKEISVGTRCKCRNPVRSIEGGRPFSLLWIYKLVCCERHHCDSCHLRICQMDPDTLYELSYLVILGFKKQTKNILSIYIFMLHAR